MSHYKDTAGLLVKRVRGRTMTQCQMRERGHHYAIWHRRRGPGSLSLDARHQLRIFTHRLGFGEMCKCCKRAHLASHAEIMRAKREVGTGRKSQ
jgi:hypothetical protein